MLISVRVKYFVDIYNNTLLDIYIKYFYTANKSKLYYTIIRYRRHVKILTELSNTLKLNNMFGIIFENLKL